MERTPQVQPMILINISIHQTSPGLIVPHLHQSRSNEKGRFPISIFSPGVFGFYLSSVGTDELSDKSRLNTERTKSTGITERRRSSPPKLDVDPFHLRGIAMNTKHHHQQIFRTTCLLLLILLLPGGGIVNGQIVGDGYNNSLIYKIQSQKNTVYLLGSIHVLAEEYYPLTRSFSYAYYNSQKIIFEIDPEILFSPGSFAKYEKRYTFQNGKTLETVLSPKTYSLVKQALKAMGADVQKVKQYKPWVLYLTLSGRFDSSVDFRPELGIENHFYRMAKDAGKPTGGLETLQDQIDVFNTLPLHIQDALLQESLAITNSQEREKAFLHMVKAWHQGSLQGLEQLVETVKKFPLFYNNLLVQRNRHWVPQIESFLQEDKNVLVIVGAAHLPGEDGLLALLAEKGYRIERISYAMP